MAQRKTEAWLTSAVEDASVPNAMVLAESIRRTKTTRIIAAITSRNVTTENRILLHKTFDIVFCMDESNTPGGDVDCPQDIHAKFFALSLSLFDKCVFISSSSVLVENADLLFKGKMNFKLLKNKVNGSTDWSLFMFAPNKEIWKLLWKSTSADGKLISEAYLSDWQKNQKGSMKWIPEGVTAKFSLAQGNLISDKTHAAVIQFIDVKNSLHAQMQLLLTSYNTGMGLREKLIMETWLGLFHEATEPLMSPTGTVSSSHAQLGNGPTCYESEPIAIIGMSCRYPGANTVEEFWNMLYQGEEGVREPPAFRWTKEHSLRAAQQERKTNAGFLSTTVDEFDAKFFGVSPKEAVYMDPQARLLHEVLWESLEDSGIDPLGLYGSRTGIFTGSWMNDYKDIVQASAENNFFRTYMGNSIGAAAARLSFLLGLTGPSIATESGCSSAIVAVDLAVKSLRCGESNLALAGGVNLLLHPFTSNIMDYVIAPDGRCKTFDSKADGFGRAEGCGVLVLKRLSDALRDRDHIWAMIRGSAVSQEGLSKSLGTPTVHCEALAMQLALEDANLSPDKVHFVETHGTGTSVGDPMEVAAISKAYYSPSRKSPLIIGSVKTNVGHTESCSGITGIMKTILAMQHELIPKHRNLDTLNPEIFLDNIPAIIPLEPVAWPKVKGQPRIAGVSSFGITGTDGHVIIEEAPDYQLPKFHLKLEKRTHLLKISGKSSEALQELLKEYQNLFSKRALIEEEKTFENAAFTANVGRASFNHRAFIVAKDYKEAAQSLSEKKYQQAEAKDGENHQICFLFTGQGSQYQGMTKTLYETSPIFRINFDACDRMLREMYNLSIREVIWDSSSEKLSRTIYSQTSIFCVEYCLLKLWQSWGIQPDYVLGHSLGEFCAAVAAGILDFKDALTLVAERSRLIDNLPKGCMLVIKASKPEVEALLKCVKVNLDIAAENSPEQTVVAGDTKQVESLLAYLRIKDVKAIILEATHAFHSRHMDPMLEAYRNVAQTINYKMGDGSVQYISGMEGRIICDLSEIDSNYWVRHTREKVSFTDACFALRELGCQDFLEIGPQPILSSFVLMNNEDIPLNCFPSIRRGAEDWQTILTSLGKLYLLGYQVDWKGHDEPYIRNKVSLPFHPFQRKSFWVECTGSKATMIHPLIGYSMNNASALSIFQNDLNLKLAPYLKDHCIGERIVFPGAGFTEMCLSAGYCVANGLSETLDPPRRAMKLENLKIDAPMEMKEGKSCRIQVVVDLPESVQKSDNQGFRIKVYHQSATNEESGKWILHASSTFLPVASTKDCMKRWNPSRIADIISKSETLSPTGFYKRADDTGLKFGEKFQMIKRFWKMGQVDGKVNYDEIVAEMEVPSDSSKYLLHPLIIDATIQSSIMTKFFYEDSKLRVPVRIGQVTIFTGLEINEQTPANNNTLYIYAWFENGKYNVFVGTQDYTPIALVEDIELVDTNVKTIESVLEQQSSSIPDAWEELWKVIPSPFNTSVEVVDMSAALSDLQTNAHLTNLRNTPAEDIELNVKTKRLLYLYILNALLELNWTPNLASLYTPNDFCTELGIRPEFQKLVRFYFTELAKKAQILSHDGDSDSWIVKKLPPSLPEIRTEIKWLCLELKESTVGNVVGIYEHLSKSLSKILKGEESALDLLFPSDKENERYSAESYYQNHPARNTLKEVTSATVVTALKHSNNFNRNNHGKIYRVLEVGSGTGSMSKDMLIVLRENWGKNFELYYTDISQGFFIKAAKELEEYKDNIKFAVFNIEQSPLSQGIPLSYFDMVAATDVLHATRRLEDSLIHLRQTLRPNGVLIFTETIIAATDFTFVFGLLEGYWRYEDFHWRQNHCCAGEDVWNKVLNQSGFHSVNLSKAYCDQLACISAVASADVQVSSLRSTNADRKMEWVIFSDTDSFQVLSQVANMLDASGNRVTIALDKSLEKTDGGIAKLLNEDVEVREGIWVKDEDPSAEINSLLLPDQLQGVIYAWGMNVNETDQKNVALPFLHIAKSLVVQRKPPQLFVLTQGVHAINEDSLTCHPSAATLFGMIKSLKNENFDMFVRYVDLDQDSSSESKINQILYELAMTKDSKNLQRVQVAYRNSYRHEPRFVKASLPTQTDELKLPASTDRYHLVLPETRLISDLTFDALDEEEVGEDEVEIKVKAFALNFKDILTIIKPSAEFEALNTVGLDFAGVVTKAGDRSKSKVGDRVFGVNFKETQLPSHLVLDSRSVLGIPDNMTYWEAATLPAVFSTAYYCLITIAKMRKGETVLIHTGSGGVGLAAIQLAKHVGANIITTGGNPKKRAYLRSLGVQHVFQSRNTSFEKDILSATNGKGVDVVLNSITGPGIKEATLNATGKNGRFVEMSKLSVWTPEEVKAMRPDVDYKIVDLTVLDQEVWAELLDNLKKFLNKGDMHAIPYVKFDALHIRQAFQYFQKAKHIGKIVCSMPDVMKTEGQFKVNVPLFNSESTYLITGGLGGIGLEVCKWMQGLGATDIVLMGRNPPKPEIAAQIQEMNERGFNILVKLGDIGSYESCKVIINEISSTMKPLRGIMHCAGVLKDNLYAKQSWDSFQVTFTPKVNGTWNLHNLTINFPLEHFVVYSSLTALVGTPGQPNHSAANCFEDAFIHYRHSLGLPGTTVNWGQWSQVGCAKEISLSGVLPVSVKRMLNGLEISMRTQKRQVCFNAFESFINFSMLCPLIRSYLDNRLWKQVVSATQGTQSFKADQFWKEMDGVETKKEKMDVMSVYLKAILRTALRLEPDEPMGDDANIQELGVDSLMMLELKNSIQSLFGSRLNVTSNLLKNCNTVRLIASAVVSKLLEEDDEDPISMEPLSPPELLQLLTQDCVLPESIQAVSHQAPPKPSEIRKILVTGVTGKLAPFLIANICQLYTSVQKVVCLVRGNGDDADTATNKMKAVIHSMNLTAGVDMRKITCISGDVVMENLGLEQDKYKELCETIDAVIHCAVKNNYTEPYRESQSKRLDLLRRINVIGTINVLKLASSCKTKHVFYPSSLACGVFLDKGDDTLMDNWPEMDALQIIVNANTPGLQASMFVCEMLLKQANERNIPCKVFRFPWVAGHSQTGQLDYLNDLYILRFLSFLKIGAMPSLVIPANFLPVDMCAEYSLKLFFNNETPNEIFNVGHPQPQVEQEFVQLAKEEFGKHLEILEWDDFKQRLQQNVNMQDDSAKDVYNDQNLISLHLAEGVSFVKGYITAPDTFFRNEKVSKFIPNYGQHIPSSMEILRRDLRYLKSTGFIEKFGV